MRRVSTTRVMSTTMRRTTVQQIIMMISTLMWSWRLVTRASECSKNMWLPWSSIRKNPRNIMIVAWISHRLSTMLMMAIAVMMDMRSNPQREERAAMKVYDEKEKGKIYSHSLFPLLSINSYIN